MPKQSARIHATIFMKLHALFEVHYLYHYATTLAQTCGLSTRGDLAVHADSPHPHWMAGCSHPQKVHHFSLVPLCLFQWVITHTAGHGLLHRARPVTDSI